MSFGEMSGPLLRRFSGPFMVNSGAACPGSLLVMVREVGSGMVEAEQGSKDVRFVETVVLPA